MLNRANSEAVETVVVVLRIHTPRIEVQVATVRGGIERRRPVVAVGATIVPRRAITVAGAREEQEHARRNISLPPC